MPTLQRTFESDFIRVVFSGNAVSCDYGVDHSPEWEEVEDITIESLSIAGVDVSPKQIPLNLLSAIESLSEEIDWRS